jgi:hypothetical protein
MGYDGYVRFCRTVTDTDKLYDLMANHNYNIATAPSLRGVEAWSRMHRIVRGEIQRRAEETAKERTHA